MHAAKLAVCPLMLNSAAFPESRHGLWSYPTGERTPSLQYPTDVTSKARKKCLLSTALHMLG